MKHIAEKIYEASKLSDAGMELRNLYNILSDDFDGQELLSRFDAYVDDASEQAQNLYRQLKKV